MKSSEKKHSLARSNYSLNATSVCTVSSAQQLSGRATTEGSLGAWREHWIDSPESTALASIPHDPMG